MQRGRMAIKITEVTVIRMPVPLPRSRRAKLHDKAEVAGLIY